MTLRASGWKTLLRKEFEKHQLTYRLLLKRKGAAFQPRKLPAGWLNTTLKSEYEWQDALLRIKKAGLHSHPDGPKSWDALATLDFILSHTDASARVLDAGGEAYSPLVEWLFLYGYKRLHVLNLAFEHDFVRGPVEYVRGDCTETAYPSEYFDVIACLSVIEHGVDIEKFLQESHRILRPGGFLVVSTDYWKDPVDTEGKRAYGTEVKVFTAAEIQGLVDGARSIGFTPTGEIDYSTAERAVRWERMALDFTFIVFALRKT